MDDLEAEAAQLAAESIYTRQQWRDALACIGNRPDRREIARLCGEAAARSGLTPYAVATDLIGDEDRPGVLAAHGGNAPERLIQEQPSGSDLTAAQRIDRMTHWNDALSDDDIARLQGGQP